MTVDRVKRDTVLIMVGYASFVLWVVVIVCSPFGGFAIADVESEAFSIEPMEVRVTLPSGGADRPSTKLKVVNKEEHDVNVRIDCFHRDEDLDGAERRSLTKDIKVDVSDFTLPAGSSRYVTLSYAGPRKISREHEFRIVLRHREDKEGESSQSLDMSFVHVVSFKIAPQE